MFTFEFHFVSETATQVSKKKFDTYKEALKAAGEFEEICFENGLDVFTRVIKKPSSASDNAAAGTVLPLRGGERRTAEAE
jgi:hypothetical protein